MKLRHLARFSTVLGGLSSGAPRRRVQVKIDLDLEALAGSSMVWNASVNKSGVSKYMGGGLVATLESKEDAEPGTPLGLGPLLTGPDTDQLLIDLVNQVAVRDRESFTGLRPKPIEFSKGLRLWLHGHGRGKLTT